MRNSHVLNVLGAVVITCVLNPTGALGFTPDEANKLNALIREGQAALKQNKTQEAVDKFQAAANLDPKSVGLHSTLGYALAKLGQNDEALVNLFEAVRLDPKLSESWINLASFYQSSGNFQKAIETFEEYLRRFPKDSRVSQVRPVVAQLKAVQAENSKNKATEIDQDYYAATIRNGVNRWDTEKFPLKVFISKADSKNGFRESFSKQVEDAFTDWQTKSDKTVSFTIVEKRSASDIDVNWTNDAKTLRSQAEQGEARIQPGPKGISHVEIMLLTIPPSESFALDDQLIKWVAVHEIGHAIGLDHSSKSTDIMFASLTFDYDKKGITSRDTATLRRLYDTPIPEKVSPIAPYNEALAELDKMSDKDPKQQNFLPVIAKLESIKSRFPTFEAVEGPLAQAYTYHATQLCRDGKFAESANIFKKSLDIFPKLKKRDSNEAIARNNYALVLKKLNRDADSAAVLAGKNP